MECGDESPLSIPAERADGAEPAAGVMSLQVWAVAAAGSSQAAIAADEMRWRTGLPPRGRQDGITD